MCILSVLQLDVGIGDAVAVGLGAVDQIVEDDPLAADAMDVLCTAKRTLERAQACRAGVPFGLHFRRTGDGKPQRAERERLSQYNQPDQRIVTQLA